MAAAGLGVLVVCGVLVANRTVLGTWMWPGLGLFIRSALNLVFGVPSASTAGASG